MLQKASFQFARSLKRDSTSQLVLFNSIHTRYWSGITRSRLRTELRHKLHGRFSSHRWTYYLSLSTSSHSKCYCRCVSVCACKWWSRLSVNSLTVKQLCWPCNSYINDYSHSLLPTVTYYGHLSQQCLVCLFAIKLQIDRGNRKAVWCCPTHCIRHCVLWSMFTTSE